MQLHLRCSFNKHEIAMRMSECCQLSGCFTEVMPENAKHGRAVCYHTQVCTRTKYTAASLHLALLRTILNYQIHIKHLHFQGAAFTFLHTAAEYLVKDQNNKQCSYTPLAFVQFPGMVSLRSTQKKKKMDFTEYELCCYSAVEKTCHGRLRSLIQDNIRIFTAERFCLLIQHPFSY